MRSRTGQRTSETQPAFSISRIRRAEVSTWPRSTPCRAQVGSAWCRLCQDSPIEGIASHHTFADLSRDTNGRLPTVWQIELIDQVTWCSRLMRTREPQKKAVTAPCHDQVSSAPARAGASKDTSTQTGNWRETRTMSGSFIRSGAYLRCGVCSGSNSHIMWAYRKPLVSARVVVPYRHGECGSPSRSLNLWCLRWSATQRITGPSIAIDPATASAIFTARFGLNDLCVNSRWYPTVMPWPVTAYATRAMSTSLQPRKPPQARGTAATTARNGSAMKSARVTCSLRDWVSPPRVPLTAVSGVVLSGVAVLAAAVRVSVVSVVAVGGVMNSSSGWSASYLRNRNLRSRSLVLSRRDLTMRNGPACRAANAGHPGLRTLVPHRSPGGLSAGAAA